MVGGSTFGGGKKNLDKFHKIGDLIMITCCIFAAQNRLVSIKCYQ